MEEIKCKLHKSSANWAIRGLSIVLFSILNGRDLNWCLNRWQCASPSRVSRGCWINSFSVVKSVLVPTKDFCTLIESAQFWVSFWKFDLCKPQSIESTRSSSKKELIQKRPVSFAISQKTNGLQWNVRPINLMMGWFLPKGSWLREAFAQSMLIVCEVLNLAHATHIWE